MSVILKPNDDGSYRALWPARRFRYLLNDGRTLDVETPRDDSDVRLAVLAEAHAERIKGVAIVPDALFAP